MNSSVRAITHSGVFHPDEVFATIMLAKVIPGFVLFRTREQDIIENADSNVIVYDVGGVYEPERNRFDHHQSSFDKERADGVKYSSAGLIWNKYGEKVIGKIADEFGQELSEKDVCEISRDIDSKLIRRIDDRDNGGERLDLMFCLIRNQNPINGETISEGEAFKKACDLADSLLTREIQIKISAKIGEALVEKKIEESENGVLVFEEFVGGWQQNLLKSRNPKADKVMFAIYPGQDGGWMVQTVPLRGSRERKNKKDLPVEWGGLAGEELSAQVGVEANFCHKGLFLLGTTSREYALEIARIAIER